MTEETREAATDLRAVLTELYPLRNFDHTEFDEKLLAAIVLMRRDRKRYHVPKQLPPAYAEGAEPQCSARAKARRRESGE